MAFLCLDMPKRVLLLGFVFCSTITWAANVTEPALVHDCKYRLSDYNASGIITWEVSSPINTGNGDFHSTPPFSLAKTISWNATDDTASSALWFDTAGLNFSNDVSLEMDACAWMLSPVTENMVRLAQNDPGDCSAVVSDPCRKAMSDQMNNAITDLTQNPSPPPYSNLSAGVMDFLCGDLYTAFQARSGGPLPPECLDEFGLTGPNYDASALGRPLTNYNQSILTNAPCMEGVRANQSFVPLGAGSNGNQTGDYDKITREMDMVMFSFFPLANVERQSWNNEQSTYLKCSRVTNFAKNSVVSPELPAGTPFSHSHKLSGGAIAGAVVGSLVGAALIAAIGVWLFLRRRKRNRTRVQQPAEQNDDQLWMSEKDGTGVAELHQDQRKAELHERDIAEMPSAESNPHELEGPHEVHELAAYTHG